MTDQLRQKLTHFVTLWHENGRARFQRSSPSLDYDTYSPKTFTERRRWVALDQGSPTQAGQCGVFLLDPLTEEVYTIKAYGVPNRKVATLDSLIRDYEAANASQRAFDGRDAAGRP